MLLIKTQLRKEVESGGPRGPDCRPRFIEIVTSNLPETGRVIMSVMCFCISLKSFRHASAPARAQSSGPYGEKFIKGVLAEEGCGVAGRVEGVERGGGGWAGFGQ